MGNTRNIDKRKMKGTEMMDIVIQIGLLVLGFVMLIKGADWFVGGASSLADKLGIPQLVIGLTIVAMGTSAPEAAVSISAALKNTAENDSAAIAIGNVIGSNIMNVLLILGITAAITAIAVQTSTLKYELPFLLIITVLLFGLGYFDGVVTRLDGVILWACFIIYLLYLLWMAKKGQAELEEAETVNSNPLILVLLLVGGGACIVVGSNVTVDAATELARIFGMSERLIGLTIVAFGTSLPELITSTTAALKKKADIAVGNIVGSNVFNILFVIGTTALITDVPYNKNFFVDSMIAIAAVVLLFVCAVGKKKLTRPGGIIMLCCMAGYMIYLLV